MPRFDTDRTLVPGSVENAVDISVEFRVYGVDGGKNRYKSPVMFAVRNAQKKANIEMPYPQRVVHLKTAPVAHAT